MSTECHEGRYREEVQLDDRFDLVRSVKGGDHEFIWDNTIIDVNGCESVAKSER